MVYEFCVTLRVQDTGLIGGSKGIPGAASGKGYR